MDRKLEGKLVKFCEAAWLLAEEAEEFFPNFVTEPEDNPIAEFNAARNELIEAAGFSDIDEAEFPKGGGPLLDWIWNNAASTSSTG